MKPSAIVRYWYINGVRWLQPYRPTVILHSLYCEKFSSSDSEMDEEKIGQDNKNKQKELSKKRLQDLLLSFNKSKDNKTNVKVENYKPSPKQKQLQNNAKSDEEDALAIDYAMKKAVKDVAKDLGGDAAKTESELLESVRLHAKANANIGDLISKMDVDSEPIKKEAGLGPTPFLSGRREPFIQERTPLKSFMQGRRKRQEEPLDLLGGIPLGIFKPTQEATNSGEAQPRPKSVWDAAYEREIQLAASHPPRNYFEEVIEWTDKGKLWQFPIDNEFGLEEEKKVSFAEHIFVERHLEGWCPPKGPVRHFMELVCVGLSKNPYITVARKKAIIEWYKNYFDSKEDVLRSVGAI